jgi:hypothetical protein
MAREIKVDFYRLAMLNPNPSLNFEDTLEQINNLSPKKRVQEVLGKYTYLNKLEREGEFYFGEIIRIRMIDFPLIADLNGESEEFILRSDQGLGERAAFLFHPNTQVILLQTNPLAISPIVFSRYIELCCNLGNSNFAFDPILEENSMQRLNSFTEIEEFEIHVAGLDNAGLLREESNDNGVDEMLNLYTKFQAPTISFKISRGQRKTSDIPVPIVRDFARLWQRKTASSVQNHKKNKPRSERANIIRLTGSTPEETNVYVDLLNDRMREKVRIEERNRNLDYPTRITILRTAWNRRQDILFRMFG